MQPETPQPQASPTSKPLQAGSDDILRTLGELTLENRMLRQQLGLANQLVNQQNQSIAELKATTGKKLKKK